MLMSAVMMAARPFLSGMGILFLAFFLLLIYAMLVMAARCGTSIAAAPGPTYS